MELQWNRSVTHTVNQMVLEDIEWCWMVLEDIEMCRGVCEEVWVGAPLVSQANGQQRADKANLDFDSTIYINTSYSSQPDTYLGTLLVKCKHL